MSFRKFLLIPALARSGMQAPRDVRVAWDRYWSGITRTGKAGDVLWDADSEAEIAWCLAQRRTHMPAELPVVDVGCGNGRFTRALAGAGARAIGIDLSPVAVARAQREADASTSASFLARDMTESGAGSELARQLAPANVFVRGLFHVLSPRQRKALATNLEPLLGANGVLVLLETAFPGSVLDYLEYLGARDGVLPPQLERCVASGIPKPSAFGARELDRALPEHDWERIASGAAEVHAVGMREGVTTAVIPGFYAVLKPRRR